MIAKERQEQIEKHGRTIISDVFENRDGDLAKGAITLIETFDYPFQGSFPQQWNIDVCRRMSNKPYKQRLIIAGALIAAEIDRMLHIERELSDKTEQHDKIRHY